MPQAVNGAHFGGTIFCSISLFALKMSRISPSRLMEQKIGDRWLKTGLSLSIFISLAIATFMFFQLKKANVKWSLLQHGIMWILWISFTNSFSEEIIYRLGIVSPLQGLLSPMTIFMISAVLFGLPHLSGMPSGIIGATIAGILGLVLIGGTQTETSKIIGGFISS